MDEYVRWLENRIAVVGTELEILINARKAIEMASSELDKPKPPQVPQQKRLTLAQAVANRDAKKKPQPEPVENSGNWQFSLTEVLRLIHVALPERMTSGEIITRYYGGKESHLLTKRDKDRVYAALSYLKMKGDLKRSELGQWSIAEPEVSAALTEGETNG
jgi:hypothetical protein